MASGDWELVNECILQRKSARPHLEDTEERNMEKARGKVKENEF